jgi:hypothetical protein
MREREREREELLLVSWWHPTGGVPGWACGHASQPRHLTCIQHAPTQRREGRGCSPRDCKPQGRYTHAGGVQRHGVNRRRAREAREARGLPTDHGRERRERTLATASATLTAAPTAVMS